MKTETPVYKRLPGAKTNRSYQGRLYLANDHLLQVESTGFAETYKRFYWRDIQAIALRRTSSGRIWNWVFGLLLILTGGSLVFLISDMQSGGADDGTIVLLIFLILFALVFIGGLGMGLWLGDTCICHIRTAVQSEKLAAVGRTRHAAAAMAVLVPLIRGSQEQFSEQEFQGNLELLQSGIPPAGAPDTSIIPG